MFATVLPKVLIDTRQRLRRVAILCVNFARNMAFYRAGWDGGQFRLSGEFWKTVNGNCVDIAVLEWCKLLADPKDPHNWRKCLSKPRDFERKLLSDIKISKEEFDGYVLEFRKYRDKFIAHLDHELIAHIPPLDTAWCAVQCYYDYLWNEEARSGDLKDLPSDLRAYYRQSQSDAEAQYRVQPR